MKNNEIKCPHCGSAFTVNESEYATLLEQIKAKEIEKAVDEKVKLLNEKAAKDSEIAVLNAVSEKTKELAEKIAENEDKIKKAVFPKAVKEKAFGELKKLKMMGPMSAEAGVIRTYLDWLISVPWKTKQTLKNDLTEAKRILDEDHYGLEKVKEIGKSCFYRCKKLNKEKKPLHRF